MVFQGNLRCIFRNSRTLIQFYCLFKKYQNIPSYHKPNEMGKTNTLVQLNEKKEEAASKIEMIKNLIFGDSIEAYDSEFDLLKKDILKKKNALEDLIEEVRKDLKTAIDNVATDVNIRITELEDKIDGRIENLEADKVDKKMLGKMLMDLGEKVSQK